MNSFDTREFVIRHLVYFAEHPEISSDTHVIVYEFAENREDPPIIIGHRRKDDSDIYTPCPPPAETP